MSAGQTVRQKLSQEAGWSGPCEVNAFVINKIELFCLSSAQTEQRLNKSIAEGLPLCKFGSVTEGQS